MTEAAEAAKPIEAQPSAGEATRLIALLENNQLTEATNLTTDLAAETATWRGDATYTAAQFAEKVKGWWVRQYQRSCDDEYAKEIEQIWVAAAARKKEALADKAERANAAEGTAAGGLAEQLNAAIAKNAAAEPKVAPEPASHSLLDFSPRAELGPWPDAPTAPPDATDLERLTYPHGLLGHVVQYIVDTAQLPDRWMALAGALSACAKGLDRKVIGPGGNSVVLWVVLIAETGAGKQHILSCIRTILRAMELEKVLVASGIASVQSIEEVLEGNKKGIEGQPSPRVDVDEYGSLLSRISSKGQTGNVSEIPSTLQTLWGWPPEDPWHGSMKVGKEVTDVHGPAFSIFGTSTSRAFFGAIKKKEVSSGFVNRHLLFDAGRGAARMVDPRYPRSSCPSWLVKALKEVAGKPAPIDNRPLRPTVDGAEVTLRDFRRIDWASAEVNELWRQADEQIRGMPSVEDRELWIRAPEMALRIATVVAVFSGRNVVEAVDWQWAIAVARRSMDQIEQGYAKHALEEYEQADLVDHIREEFRQKTILREGQIRKLCERKTGDHRKIDWAIDHLLKCGDITELDPASGPGRPTKRWEWCGKKRGVS
jgi:hypothetical protein